MSAVRGVAPQSAVRLTDWLDRLWEYEDLAPVLAVRRERSGGPACVNTDPELFFPQPWEVTPVERKASPAEREALAVCAGCPCPVQSWCLAQDLDQSSTASVIIGVRGGLRQSERRALHRLLRAGRGTS
ncbi:WhiB family transcriptional regulator [Streptomyces sp. Isolate_45]|uniref:WhiB family transcriptional regulator n=1 Tax=Streptomyces sp. Isolate_45 TaxID=2950111 RepID=UPI002481CEAB|nr:WhiB family transcriptional regulator [Streptomyces sp. Isolate_45]MDA5283675.1 WhiB family transcriptional regulator [Streptomyces sp. Isolate_45]